MRRTSLTDVTAVIVAAALLIGAAAERLSLPRPKDAEPFHARVRAAVAQVPATFGDWDGKDVPVPAEATQQLRPNVIISRQFSNRVNGRAVSFLLVQCSDVRDLTPHYPPICYPGRGLTLTNSRERSWAVDGLNITGTEYQFDSNTFRQSHPIAVANFMLLPTGVICPEMKTVRAQIALPNRYFGAAQVQVVMDADVPEADRDVVLEQMVRAYRPVIDAVLSGVER